MKTLIVEDDPVTRRLLEEILEPYADFISLGNGKDALEALHTAWENHSPFDLVVLDIVLPHADGNYVLEEIRDYEESNEVGPEQRIAVLITTGHENYENFKRAYSAGYQGFIPKPIDRANVVALLKNLDLVE